MPSVDCIVLDFDGTFTAVDREAAPFLDGYRSDFAKELGGDTLTAWERAGERISATPAMYGWEYDGRVVAPSHADPYIRATSIAQMVMSEQGYPKEKRADLLQRLYRTNYAKSEVVFRDDAKEAIEGIVALGRPVFVVTNSFADAVGQKLATLAPRGADKITIFGDAKKYVIADADPTDDAFRALPESLEIPGLPRPVLLRRGRYYDVLRQIWASVGTGPAGTIVCGDIYELDLAMPSQLGTQIQLVSGRGTAPYEEAAVRKLPNGGVHPELSAIVDRLRAS